jgi:putative oxidoreductase
MTSWRSWAFDARGPRATAIVRAVVGVIFVSEGIQKFLFAEDLGVGRFTKIGIPLPSVTAPFVACVEIVGGTLLVLGLATRVVAIPLLFSMFVAITSTKVATFTKNGFWKTMHEARTDLLMIAGLLFVLLVGAGSSSMDGRFFTSRRSNDG